MPYDAVQQASQGTRPANSHALQPSHSLTLSALSICLTPADSVSHCSVKSTTLDWQQRGECRCATGHRCCVPVRCLQARCRVLRTAAQLPPTWLQPCREARLRRWQLGRHCQQRTSALLSSSALPVHRPRPRAALPCRLMPASPRCWPSRVTQNPMQQAGSQYHHAAHLQFLLWRWLAHNIWLVDCDWAGE